MAPVPTTAGGRKKPPQRPVMWSLPSTVLLLVIGTMVGKNLLEITVYGSRFTTEERKESEMLRVSAPAFGGSSTTADAASASTTDATKTKTRTVNEVDCRTFRAENDPNQDLEKDTSKLVNLTRDDDKNTIPTPEFWISLHKYEFDRVRWKSIMNKGIYYETGITHIFQEILQPSEPKGLVLDVGMNIGWFTLLSRAMGHSVMAFDPNGIMHQRVCESIAHNQWWDNNNNNNNNNAAANTTTASSSSSSSSSEASGISTFMFGLGDTVGSLEFSVNYNPGGGTFVGTRYANISNPKLKTKTRRWQVPVTTLDVLARERGWVGSSSIKDNSNSAPHLPIIHLLKIDVEGYETHVFRGASELIRSGLIRNILHENTHEKDEEAAMRDVAEAFGNLTDVGYKIHAITNTAGLIPPLYGTAVGPVNLMLRNGTFVGSDLHRILAAKATNIWWKRLVSSSGGSSDSDKDDVIGVVESDTLEASVALWNRLESEYHSNDGANIITKTIQKMEEQKK